MLQALRPFYFTVNVGPLSSEKYNTANKHWHSVAGWIYYILSKYYDNVPDCIRNRLFKSYDVVCFMNYSPISVRSAPYV